jgi:hypothetical protein
MNFANATKLRRKTGGNAPVLAQRLGTQDAVIIQPHQTLGLWLGWLRPA